MSGNASPQGWEQQPDLSNIFRLDIIEHLPLPAPQEGSSALPQNDHQLLALLALPGVLQGVQHALASNLLQHIVPRQHYALPSAAQDPILSSLLQGHPDLLNHTAPPAAIGVATPGLPESNQGLPEVEGSSLGVEDHLLTYTDPAVAVQASRARAREAPTTECKAKRRRVPKPRGSEEGEDEGGGYEAPVAADPDRAASQLCGILTGLLGNLAWSADAGAQEEGDLAARPERLPPAKVHMLSGVLMSARSQGYLSKVPSSLLQTLLRALHQVMVAGASPVIPDSREKSLELTLVLDALEAAVAATHVLSVPDLPPQVYMEEVVQSVVQLAQHHTQVNVLAVLDDRYRRLWRPQEPVRSLAQETAAGKKGARAPKTPRTSTKANPHLLSSHLDLLLPPLEQLLVLLADMLGAVKVDASQVLPLINVMMGCLSVGALSRVFQVKAAGVAVAVFRALPEQRPVILAELLSPSMGLLGACAATSGGGGASAKAPAREFLAQDEPPIQIQVSTALILQLVQSTSQLPPLEETDLQVIQDFCKVPISWCDRLWVTLLEKLPASKNTNVDVKAFLEHFVQDLLAVQHTPEWPAAQLLLRRLVMALNTSKGLQHPESPVRLVCIDLLGTITSSFTADCKQAEEEQEKVEQLLSASGYDAEAMREGGIYLGDEDKQRIDALQRLLLGVLAARPLSGTRQTARTLIIQQMLLQRAVFEQQQAHIMSSQPQEQLPAPEPARPAKGKKGRKGQSAAAVEAAAAREEEARRQAQAAQQGSAILAEYHALLSAPPRVVAIGAEVENAACISRWLLLNSAMGRGRSSFLLWLVNAGSTVAEARRGGIGAGGLQGTSTAERSRAVKALGSAIEMDERVLGHVDVQTAVCAALGDDAVSVREAAVDLLGRHISYSPELAMAYFDLIGRASNDAGLSVRKRAVKVLWDCCVHFGTSTEGAADGAPAFTRACEAVSLILARAADPEDSMRKLATGLCAGLLFTPGGASAATEGDIGGSAPGGSSLAAAVQCSSSAQALLLAEVCDLVYHTDAAASIKLPLSSDHCLVVVLKAILSQSSTSQPIAGGGRGAAAAQAAAVRQGAAELSRALLAKIMELQEAAAAASAAMDAAHAGISLALSVQTALHPPASATAGPPDAGSPHNKGATAPAPSAFADASIQQEQQQGGRLLEGAAASTFGSSALEAARGAPRSKAAEAAAAAEASLEAAEHTQLQCLLALHALCAADLGILLQASGGAAYFVRGLAPYFKELVTVGDKSSPAAKRARSERLMCAMHIVAALAGRAEGVTRLEAGLVKDLVSDLQQIIGRHVFVSVVSSAVQCMCSLNRLQPNLVAQHILGLSARYHLMLENDLNGGQTETSAYRSMYSKLLFILGNFCRYAAPILDSHAGQQVEVPSASTTSAGPAQAVSCRACLSLFLDFFTQGSSPSPGGVTPKVTEAALQAMGLLFTARPELMWDVRGNLTLLEAQLQPTSLLSHKSRVLQNLIDLLKAEEEGLLFRQKKVEDEYLAQPSFGTLTTPTTVPLTLSNSTATASHGRGGSSVRGKGTSSRGGGGGAACCIMHGAPGPSTTTAAAAAAAAAVSGAAGMGVPDVNGVVDVQGGMPTAGGQQQGVLARRNGEGDQSSISSDVVRKLWPSILQAGTDTGAQAQGGSALACGVALSPHNNAATLQEAIRNAATVRRRVLELIEVSYRGGLTAPWDAIPALVALSTDPLLDTSTKALRVLKQCCEHHAPLVPAKLAAGITDTYRFQMSLAKVTAAVASGDSSGSTRKPPRPPTPRELLGGGALPEALSNLWTGVVATDRTRKSKFLSALLKPFEEASCLAVQGAARGGDMHLLAFFCAATVELPYKKADEPLTLLTTINSIVARRGHPAMTALKHAMYAASASTAQQAGAAQAQSVCEAVGGQGEMDEASQQEQQGGCVPPEPAAVPYEVAAKASLAVSMLLLLKKFLQESYRLADERVASYAGPGGTVLLSSRKVEEKAGVNRDARIQLMLYDDVLDLTAPHQAPDSKAARELYKTIKYLMSEDAANYRPPPSLIGEDGCLEGAEGAADGDEANGALPAIARTAKAGCKLKQAQQQKHAAKKKRRARADSEEEEEEGDGDSEDADFVPRAAKGKQQRAKVAGAKQRAGGRQRKWKCAEDYDEEQEDSE